MKIVNITVVLVVLVSFPTIILSSEWESLVGSENKRENPMNRSGEPGFEDEDEGENEDWVRQFDMSKTLDAFIIEAKSKYRSMPPGDFAKWLTGRIDNHVQALNLNEPDEAGTSDHDEYVLNLRKEAYKWFFDQGEYGGLDKPYSNAYWTWGFKMGHCDQHAKTTYHILTMVTGRNDNFVVLNVMEDVGHAYVVWGDTETEDGIKELIPKIATKWDFVHKLKDVWILDPWGGISKKTSEVTGSGNNEEFITGKQPDVEIMIWKAIPYQHYMKQFEKYSSYCDNLEGQEWDIGIPNKDYLTVTGIEKRTSHRLKHKLGEKVYCKKKDKDRKVHRLQFLGKKPGNDFCNFDFCWYDREIHRWFSGRAMSNVIEKYSNIRNKTQSVHLEILGLRAARHSGFISTVRKKDGTEGVWVRLSAPDIYTDDFITYEGFLTLPNGFPF